MKIQLKITIPNELLGETWFFIGLPDSYSKSPKVKAGVQNCYYHRQVGEYHRFTDWNCVRYYSRIKRLEQKIRRD